MKRLLNTLYVTSQGAYLSRESQTIHVQLEQETLMRVPVQQLASVVCIGNVAFSSGFLALCSEFGVGVSCLSESGRFQGRMEGPVRGNVLLRRQQYRTADDARSASAIVTAIVGAKIANSRAVLLRSAREHAGQEASEKLKEAATHLASALRALDLESGMAVPLQRGIEGDAAHAYFSVFDHLILAQKEEFVFTVRSRRPPLDPVNALLSFLYTLLVHECVGALEAVGLDPAVGFLHTDRPGRPSLALDLAEEFRAPFADRQALSLINRRQLQSKHFERTESGGVWLNDKGRREVIQAWQERKREELQHPFLGESCPWGLLPYVQALLLARYLRGDMDAYPAFFWK
ncbi:MAG: type I-C CRISPR-associated endonuclease Cas1c [Terracidiphilus sp.]|nr:type I-C CRISPR-associated endonuclease Cas1c [Terracidiphilus sp.]